MKSTVLWWSSDTGAICGSQRSPRFTVKLGVSLILSCANIDMLKAPYLLYSPPEAWMLLGKPRRKSKSESFVTEPLNDTPGSPSHVACSRPYWVRMFPPAVTVCLPLFQEIVSAKSQL